MNWDIVGLIEKLKTEIKILEFAVHHDFINDNDVEVRENLLRDYLERIENSALAIEELVVNK